jgi:hypothetical protein
MTASAGGGGPNFWDQKLLGNISTERTLTLGGDGFCRVRFIGQRVFLPGGPVAMLNTILLMILIGMIPCGIIVLVFEIAANRKLRQRH